MEEHTVDEAEGYEATIIEEHTADDIVKKADDEKKEVVDPESGKQVKKLI